MYLILKAINYYNYYFVRSFLHYYAPPGFVFPLSPMPTVTSVATKSLMQLRTIIIIHPLHTIRVVTKITDNGNNSHMAKRPCCTKVGYSPPTSHESGQVPSM